jgi:hypothetical protein
MPTLFQLTKAQITSTTTQTLSTLVIDGNDSVNGDYLVFLQLLKFTMNVFEITGNNATSVVVIDVPSDVQSDLIILKNGEVTSNTLWSGAVFKIREGSDMTFSNGDSKPSSTEPSSFKILIDTVKFTFNYH